MVGSKDLFSIDVAKFFAPLLNHLRLITVRLLDGNGKPFVDHALELALSQPLAQVNTNGERKSNDDDSFIEGALVLEVVEVHGVSVVFLG